MQQIWQVSCRIKTKGVVNNYGGGEVLKCSSYGKSLHGPLSNTWKLFAPPRIAHYAIILPRILEVQCPTGEWDSQLKWDNPNNFWYGGHRYHIWSQFCCLDSNVSTEPISWISNKFKLVFERCPTWLTCPICLSSTIEYKKIYICSPLREV